MRCAVSIAIVRSVSRRRRRRVVAWRRRRIVAGAGRRRRIIVAPAARGPAAAHIVAARGHALRIGDVIDTLHAVLVIARAGGAAQKRTDTTADQRTFRVASKSADTGAERGADNAVSKLGVVRLIDLAARTAACIILAIILVRLEL